jgi:hypothetical protein
MDTDILDENAASAYARQGTGCKILGFHGGDYEECHFLACYALWLL